MKNNYNYDYLQENIANFLKEEIYNGDPLYEN